MVALLQRKYLFVVSVNKIHFSQIGVGVYIDGVYYARSSAGNFGLMNIESIEVLRGPQGTLFGKNTIGGAVNITTRTPSGETAGKIEATYGRYDRQDFGGWYEFPITDNIYASISGQQLKRDGYVKALYTCRDLTQIRSDCQMLGDMNKKNAQVQFRYDPSDDLDVVLRFDAATQSQNAPAGALRATFDQPVVDLYNQFVAPTVAERFALTGEFAQFGDAFVNRIDETEDFWSGTALQTHDDNDVYGSSLTVEKDIGSYQIKSITAWRNIEIANIGSADFSPFQLIDVGYEEEHDQYSQEFQLSGSAMDDRLTFIVGAFYMQEEGESQLIAPLYPGLGPAEIPGHFADILPNDITQRLNAELDSTSMAVYGEGTYNFTDKFSMTLGARLNRDEKEFKYAMTRYFSSFVIPDDPNRFLGGPFDVDETWTEFLPRFGLEYQFNEDHMVYFTSSRGYKAGGWNPRQPGQLLPTFDPEFVDSFEVGHKGTLFDGKLTINSSLFWMDYTDIQLTQVTSGLVDGQPTVVTAVLNGGEARIKGAEFELQAMPVPQLLFTASLGLMDAEYLDLDPGVIQSGISENNDLNQTPETTFNASVNYTWDLQHGYELSWYTDIAFKDSIHHSPENFKELEADSYWIGNTRLTLTTETGFEIAAGVTNFTDEIYLSNGVDVRGAGFTEAFYNRPREWYLSVSKTW